MGLVETDSNDRPTSEVRILRAYPQDSKDEQEEYLHTDYYYSTSLTFKKNKVKTISTLKLDENALQRQSVLSTRMR